MKTHQNRAADAGTGREPGRAPRPSQPAVWSTPVGPAAVSLLQLQRIFGNAAVGRLLADERAVPADSDSGGGGGPESEQSSETVVARTAFEVVIPRRSPRPSPAAPLNYRGRKAFAPDPDAEEGVEAPAAADPGEITAAFTLPSPDLPSPEDGGTLPLPDVKMPEGLQFDDPDAVAGAITHSPTITQAGVVNPFGSTRWSTFNITGVTVTSAGGTFTVRFTLENPITYNVTSPKTSIASENDPALTNSNFAEAATDLTPRMDVQNGKPRRRRFWARDLTLRHERFHSNERSRLNAAGAEQAQTWLSSQTAANVGEVQALIAQVPGRVITASQAAVGTLDEKESRAYGDGAPAYRARANAIRTKGALGPEGGGYPA